MARPGLGSLLLMGAAAFGLYKYSIMSEQEKRNLKEKGKKLYDENVPENIKGMFGKQGQESNFTGAAGNGSANATSNTGSRFGEGSDYTS